MSEDEVRKLGYEAGFLFGVELSREMQSYGDSELVAQVELAITDRDIVRMFAVKQELKRRKEATNDATR